MSTFYMSNFILVFDYPHSKVARGSPVFFKKKLLLGIILIYSAIAGLLFELIFL